MHNGWMFGMGWLWILALVLVGALVWVAVRAGTRSGSPRSGKSPEEVLQDRLARGEIDEEEYRSRLNTLRDQP